MAARPAAKSYEYHSDGRASDDACARLAQRIDEVCLDAVASLPPTRIEETALQWLAKALFDPSDPSNALPVMEAFALAGYVTLFSPSLLGAAPIERFIRQRRADADDVTRAAMDALAQSTFHLVRLKSRVGQTLAVEDIANGESLSLLDAEIPDGALSAFVAVWLAPLPNGDFVALGPLTPLDAAALGEGLAFVRPGKGMSNPRRCAAAVYRHVVRQGGLRIEGLNDFTEDLLHDGASNAAEEEYDDLDRLAFAITGAKESEALSAELIEDARRIASPLHLFHALARSVNARRHGRADIAAAFLRIGFVMIETLDRRAVAESGDDSQIRPLEMTRGRRFGATTGNSTFR